MNIPKVPFVILLVLLNAAPIYGVFVWDWESFDLIFLYWLENLIIGLFAVFRFLARWFMQRADQALPLLLAPFFVLHYGIFCFGHGTFIVSLFGKEALGDLVSQGVFDLILPIINTQHLLWPVVSLFMYQLLDWIRDISRSPQRDDAIKELMVAPYRRIIVLHLTIIGSGFVLSALHEPLAGLLILILLKTLFDLYHWNKDEQKAKNPILNTEEVDQAAAPAKFYTDLDD